MVSEHGAGFRADGASSSGSGRLGQCGFAAGIALLLLAVLTVQPAQAQGGDAVIDGTPWVNYDGAYIVIKFNQVLNVASIQACNLQNTNRFFTVRVNGDKLPVRVVQMHRWHSVSGSTPRLQLIFSSRGAIRKGETVTVSYNDIGSPIKTRSNNFLLRFSNVSVRNNSRVRDRRQKTYFKAADATVAEGPGKKAVFEVTLKYPESHFPVTVDYTTRNGTARAGSDYTAKSGTIRFSPGTTSRNITVDILDDDHDEASEDFFVDFDNAQPAAIARIAASDSTATGIITNTEVPLAGAPRVTGVSLAADASGDGVWTAGEQIEVRLTFSKPVVVAGGTPSVGVTVDGSSALTVPYSSGSGTDTLVFSMEIQSGERTDVTVEENSLRTNGATIVSLVGDVPAALGHVNQSAESDLLTAEFRDFSVDAHDGSTAFSFELRFSEDWTSGLSYATLRDHAFTVTNGQLTARRLEDGKNQRWKIIVEPDSDADVTIMLPETTDCGDPGAICIGARPLSIGASVRVPGPPPRLTVADARVTEAEDATVDATVDFTVTLSRAAAEAVTVDYATSDSTATAGADYTSTSGMLTFTVGETEKTVSVPVIDDSHDESDETFTLTLSNPSGGNAYLEDATATGTIADDDEAEVLLTAEFGISRWRLTTGARSSPSSFASARTGRTHSIRRCSITPL